MADKVATMKNLQKNNPYYVGVENVIHVTTRKGDGTEGDPVRFVEHFYNMDGHLLFESE